MQRFESTSLSWGQITSLKGMLSVNCPALNLEAPLEQI